MAKWCDQRFGIWRDKNYGLKSKNDGKIYLILSFKRGLNFAEEKNKIYLDFKDGDVERLSIW